MPNAGSLQQQLQQEQQSTGQALRVQRPAKGKADASPVGQAVVVQTFKFEGNTLLSDAKLNKALLGLKGRPIDFTQLQSSTVLVADLYRKKGWVVQTLLPEQDVFKGEVTIVVVEAVFGQLQIASKPTKRVAPETVLSMFAQQKPGQFLNMNALDRALLLADDLPGLTVSGTLAPGEQSPQTDVILQMADKALLEGAVSADNTGSISTGKSRANLALSVNSPMGLGDALAVNAMSSQGAQYARMSYSLPLGWDGWRMGINISHLDYALISAAYTSLNAKGNSVTKGLELSYPMVRSRSVNLTTSLSADKKEYVNLSGGNLASDYNNLPLTLGLAATSSDALGGGGANALSLLITSGRLNLEKSPTQASDSATTQTAGTYSKVRYSLSRQQQVNAQTSIYMAISGQWANKNLDSSEKFYLGGSSGVRAYPSNEGGGSLGQMVNLELRWQLPEGVNFVWFYDYGLVTPNVNNRFPGASALNSFAFKGTGTSLNWRHSAGLTLQATYARRIGQNSNPITTEVNRGFDQDGTLTLNRLWLSASMVF